MSELTIVKGIAAGYVIIVVTYMVALGYTLIKGWRKK